MYAMMAMRLTLVYRLLRILHIAHARVFTLGAYIAVVVANATGNLLLATVTDPQMGESFGVDPRAVGYRVFFFGSALAGIAGVLIGLLNNYVEPTMGAVVSYKPLAIIVLGGLGNVRGTLIASLVLGVV